MKAYSLYSFYKSIWITFFILFSLLVNSPFNHAWGQKLDTTAKRIVMIGDSLTAGYGLQAGEDFPSVMQRALQESGKHITIENAGVSGDTTAGGLSRLEWSIAGDKKPDLVIIALGANDMLRGLPVHDTKNNLEKMIETLRTENIPVFLIGMKASRQYPAEFQKKFNSLYTDLAKKYKIPLYPFFLEGVALNPSLNLQDGIHPNNDGIKVMVDNIKPSLMKYIQ
jgi:acyl-CoA thioesterase-1